MRRFRDLEANYRRRGIILQDATFPTVTVAFCAVKLKPAPILGAVRIDFTDYDLRPPSVRFVDPFTHEEITAKDMTMQLLRLPKQEGVPREMLVAMLAQGALQLSALVQSDSPEAKPFLCLPGVREYHDNPAHTGDSWLLHRTSGEGCLAFIVENIWKYGPNITAAFAFQVQTEGEHGLRMNAQMETRRALLSLSFQDVPA